MRNYVISEIVKFSVLLFFLGINGGNWGGKEMRSIATELSHFRKL